jgi:D-beta-D-heptose 7-phosphate kinase/D-beta-D-heptose 1-phosphate adenosyltransferase
LSDYGKGALADVTAMIDLCRNADIPVLVDPKGSAFDKYRGATVLTPNQSELNPLPAFVNPTTNSLNAPGI